MRDVSARMIGGVDFRTRVWQTGWLGGGRCEAGFDGVFCDYGHITIRRIRNVEVVSGSCETSLLR